MPQPPFKPKMWNRMNKTNRHLVRRPWARAWLRGYVCDYSLMTSSDGLMLQWRHWAGPLATHQPEQSVTHGSLLLITEIQSRKHTKAQVHFATSSPHVSPESGSVSSGCRRRDKRRFLCPLFAYERNLHGIFISWCLKSKAFERRVLQKAISHLCKGDTRARTKCSAAGNSVWGADRLFIDIWTLHKCKALFTNQRLRVHIRIYNSYSMRRDCHSGMRGRNQRQRESETRWWKKLFHRYRWWWSSASIWNQVFSSVSPEVSSVQQMDVTKPGANTTQIKCLKQNPTSTEALSKIATLVMVKKHLCRQAAKDSWKCSCTSIMLLCFLMLFLCKRQRTQSWWERGARQSTIYQFSGYQNKKKGHSWKISSASLLVDSIYRQRQV